MRRGREPYKPVVICGHAALQTAPDYKEFEARCWCVLCGAVRTVPLGDEPQPPAVTYKTNFPNFKKV